MKHINELKVWRKEQLELDHRIAIATMIQQQISLVGDLMSRHQELVKSPLAYNLCAGLLDQLKAHSQAAYLGGFGSALAVPLGATTPDFRDTPLYGAHAGVPVEGE
jgi:hypothetical protein